MRKNIFALCLLVSLFCLPSRVFAQWYPWAPHYLTFDAEDTIWQTVINVDTVNCSHNLWQVGRPQKAMFDSAKSYPNAIVTDTLNPYSSNDTSQFTLKFPRCSDMGAYQVVIGFDYKLNIDSLTSAFFELSTNSGVSWWSPQYFYQDTSVQNNSWHNYSISVYGDHDNWIRFSFISGHDTVTKEGWMIDNPYIYYRTESISNINENSKIQIYPNPTADLCTISYDGELFPGASVSIVNALGKRVGVYPLTGHRMQLPVGDLPPGLYNCIVNSGDGYSLHQKLVVMK